MEQTHLAKRVKSLRQKKGFSQEQLAEESGLSLRTIQRIENGETQSTGATLKLLADALSVNAEDLLDWGLKEDTNYLVSLHMSALTFLIFPLLGILVPAVMWMSKKDKLKGLNETASALINFQITWTLLLFGIPLSALLVFSLIGVEMVLSKIFIFSFGVIIIMYAYNLIVIFINTARLKKEEPVSFKPSIPFIKG